MLPYVTNAARSANYNKVMNTANSVQHRGSANTLTALL